MENQKIIIHKPEELSEKIRKIKDCGTDSLHVLSDFDRSFTKCFVDGKKFSTSWAQFRNLNILGEDYLEKSSEMFEYYRPIEISTEINEEEKRSKLREWWEKHLSLLVEKGLSKKDIDFVVEKGGIRLRDDAKKILNFLKNKNIPLIFISSGIGNIISGTLSREGVLYDNINIASNFFTFDDSGATSGFEGDMIINSQNKNEASLEKLAIFDKIKDRRNVILIGDALEDLKMLGGIGYDTVISIGFLNEDVENSLENFKENFDIVITGDGNMEYIIELLHKIGD